MIKILVMSDTHGLEAKVDEILEKHKDVDFKIHLGDSEKNIIWLQKRFDHFVPGNMDSFSWVEKGTEKIFEIFQKKIFICHGHTLQNKAFDSSLSEVVANEARIRGCTIAMHGHNHRLIWQKVNDILVLNPGSLRSSRDEKKESYVILHIDSNGNVECSPYFLN